MIHMHYAESTARAAMETQLDAGLAALDEPTIADIVWTVRPQLVHCRREAANPVAGRRRDLVRHLASVGAGRSGPTCLSVGSIVLVADTANHRAVLEPVAVATASRLAAEVQSLAPAPAKTWGRADLRKATHITRAVVEAGAAADVALCEHAVRRLVLSSLRSSRRAEVALGRAAVVVVSNQHQPHLRAWIGTARRADVRSVFLPHSALALTRDHLDVPTDAAGFRSAAEVAVIEASGGRGRMAVVGNPAFPSDPEPSPAEGPIVFAPSPVGPDRLRDLIGLAEAGLKDSGFGVLVSPHPRSDLTVLERLLPSAWRLDRSGTPTRHRLRDGAHALLQSNSGVAWEGLAFGIPTIELQLPVDGSGPLTALAASGTLPVVTRPEQLRCALGRAVDQRELVDAARAWCSFTGRAATDRAAELVHSVLEDQYPSGPILDVWRKPPSVAAVVDGSTRRGDDHANDR